MQTAAACGKRTGAGPTTSSAGPGIRLRAVSERPRRSSDEISLDFIASGSSLSEDLYPGRTAWDLPEFRRNRASFLTNLLPRLVCARRPSAWPQEVLKMNHEQPLRFAEEAEPMPRLIRLPDVLEATGLARSTVYRLVAEHRFPAPVKLAARAVAGAATTCGSGSTNVRAFRRGDPISDSARRPRSLHLQSPWPATIASE